MVFIAVGAGLTTTLILGTVLIPLLYRLKFGQEVRDDGPRSHLKKQGTATMGGLMILGGTGLTGLLLAGNTSEMRLLFGIMFGCGLIGFVDDFLKVVLRRPLGLKARAKILGQLLMGALLAWGVHILGRGTLISVPVIGITIQAGILYYFFIVFVLICTTNAVNLTDGLDGLAVGLMAIASGAYVIIARMHGQTATAIFAGALAGSCLGFLCYNYHPARVFMGDTGSLALGGALTALAVLTRTELLLLILGGVFVLETLSVIIQVVSFRLTGRRVFKMSPLHHHFELSGWPEVKVVHIFWLVGLCFAILGLWMV
ncbi:MAG TPA: phospho-N-acetylmuramoyl-pentapeptide-transferase [Syntrophomonadaceae bacterium]|nr:phospho-N-acetylmuramoyl-pentapeptide-transferase [Syntrophomonadaceae bacterium]